MKSNYRNKYLNSFFDRTIPLSGVNSRKFESAKHRFQELNIRSNADLLNVYTNLRKFEKFVALCIFRDTKFKGAIRLLFIELFCNDALLPGAAGAALATADGERVFRRLVRIFRGSGEEKIKIMSMYTLSVYRWYSKINKEEAFSLYIEVFGNRKHSIDCRLLACDGIARAANGYDRRKRVFRLAIEVLMSSLKDPDPDIRYSAVQALGESGWKGCSSELNKIAKTDHSECRRYTDIDGKRSTVSQMAMQVMREIETGRAWEE